MRAAPIQDSPVQVQIVPRSGSVRLVCTVDGRRAKACTRTFRVKLGPGRHTISARALDRHGRASAARSVAVVVPERAPPSIAVGADPVAIASSGNDVWVSNGSAGTVSRIDAASRRVVATIGVSSQLGGIAATPSAVWLSDFGAGAL